MSHPNHSTAFARMQRCTCHHYQIRIAPEGEWILDNDFFPFHAAEARYRAAIVRDKGTSRVYAIHHTDRQPVYLKFDKCRGKLDRLKHCVRRSRSMRAGKALSRLQPYGIHTPTVLAVGECRRLGVLQDSFLVTEAVPGASPLTIWSETGKNREEHHRRQRRLLPQLTALLHTLHANGIYHRDLNAGNILVQDATNEPVLYLLDADRVHFHCSMTLYRRLLNLACLYQSLPHLPPRDGLRFLLLYFRGHDRSWVRLQAKRIYYLSRRWNLPRKRRKRRSEWSLKLEHAAARITLTQIKSMPLARACELARILAAIWFECARRQRRVAIENIVHSNLPIPTQQAPAIARRSYQNFAQSVVEALKSDTLLTGQNLHERFLLEIDDETMQLLNDPTRGAILASGHIGNWEIAAQRLSLFKPVVGIARKMSNPYTDHLVSLHRPVHRFRTTPKRDADFSRLLSVLARKHILAYMMDQYAGQHGVMIDFMGRPASCHSAIAMLHMITNTPIVFGYCVRLPDQRLLLHADKPFRYIPGGSKQENIHAILSHLNQQLEMAIHAYPDQYLWAHRRWRIPRHEPAA